MLGGSHLSTTSLGSTASPTASPTARATPEPTINAGAEEYRAFLIHLKDRPAQFLASYDAIEEAVVASDYAAVATAAGILEVTANNEIVWLDENPPAPCYGEVHRLHRATAQTAADAGHNLMTGATDLDFALLQKGTASLIGISTEMSQVTAAMKLVSC